MLVRTGAGRMTETATRPVLCRSPGYCQACSAVPASIIFFAAGGRIFHSGSVKRVPDGYGVDRPLLPGSQIACAKPRRLTARERWPNGANICGGNRPLHRAGFAQNGFPLYWWSPIASLIALRLEALEPILSTARGGIVLMTSTNTGLIAEIDAKYLIVATSSLSLPSALLDRPAHCRYPEHARMTAEMVERECRQIACRKCNRCYHVL
jgi:hypothetical protein